MRRLTMLCALLLCGGCEEVDFDLAIPAEPAVLAAKLVGGKPVDAESIPVLAVDDYVREALALPEVDGVLIRRVPVEAGR